MIEFRSFIRGYHVYQTTWAPNVDDVLCLECKPSICNERFAIAIMDGSSVVEHLSYNIAPTISHFLRRSVDRGEAVVTGQRVN